MSGRFVRASKYRHVHGPEPKKDKQFTNIRPQCTGDGNFVAGNNKFFGVPVQGGGGPLLIHRLDKLGRIEHNAPVLNVHKAKVLDLAFSPYSDQMVATASEDCYVKVSMIPKEGLTETLQESVATLEGHQKKVHSVQFHPTASNLLCTTSYDNTIKIWDYEKQVDTLTYNTPEQVMALRFNTDGSRIGMTTKDKMVRLYDPRAPDAATEVSGFQGTKASKFEWLDNHGFFITVGFTKASMRQYAIWDPKMLKEPIDLTDIDQSAGVLMTHYDPDSSMLYMAGKGDGNIRYFEIVPEAPYCHFLSEFRSSNSQKGIGFLPKTAVDTKSCTIQVGLRLLRDAVVPIHFQVPRKSEMFQEDLYPETYAGVATLTADEWLAGQNAAPKMCSMNPKERGEEKADVVFVAKKSPAELQAELDVANKRIAELEAMVAKLSAE